MIRRYTYAPVKLSEIGSWSPALTSRWSNNWLGAFNALKNKLAALHHSRSSTELLSPIDPYTQN